MIVRVLLLGSRGVLQPRSAATDEGIRKSQKIWHTVYTHAMWFSRQFLRVACCDKRSAQQDSGSDDCDILKRECSDYTVGREVMVDAAVIYHNQLPPPWVACSSLGRQVARHHLDATLQVVDGAG